MLFMVLKSKTTAINLFNKDKQAYLCIYFNLNIYGPLLAFSKPHKCFAIYIVI